MSCYGCVSFLHIVSEYVYVDIAAFLLVVEAVYSYTVASVISPTECVFFAEWNERTSVEAVRESRYAVEPPLRAKPNIVAVYNIAASAIIVAAEFDITSAAILDNPYGRRL